MDEELLEVMDIAMTEVCERYFKGTHRQWVGKPDPSGFGRYEVSSRDPSWLHERMLKDQGNGCRVGVMRKRCVSGVENEVDEYWNDWAESGQGVY